MKKFLVAPLILFSFSLTAQSVLDQKLNGSETGKKLVVLMDELEHLHPVKFYYLPAWIESIAIEEDYKDQTLRETFVDLFLGSDLSFVSFGDHDIIIIKDPTQAIQRNTLINTAARERKKIEKFVLGSPNEYKKGKKVLMQGSIRDSKTKDPLVGASVVITDLNTGTIRNASGNFEIKVPAGQHVVSFTFVNFEEKVIDLGIYVDGEINLTLEEEPTVLDEVVISDVSARDNTTSRIGQTQISMREIKRSPTTFFFLRWSN